MQENEETEIEERKNIKERLSTMSFEDLQKLKAKMGTKLYNETIFDQKKPKAPKDSFKRANKNRPRELSSRKHVKIETTNVISAKKQAPRDPRFEPMCGTFDKNIFKDNYKFVNDLRKKEKKQLENQLKKTSDADEKKNIKFLVQRLDNQIREEETWDRQKHEKVSERVETRNKLQQGEKPQYKKKSVKRLESLINQFEDLKKTNKIQKHIERRTKKIGRKERRKLEKEKLM